MSPHGTISTSKEKDRNLEGERMRMDKRLERLEQRLKWLRLPNGIDDDLVDQYLEGLLNVEDVEYQMIIRTARLGKVEE